MNSRLTKLSINISISLISLSISLGIIEIVLRTTHLFGASISWSQPDPLIAWRLTPNAEYFFYGENDHPVKGKINNYGWRDKDRSIQKHLSTIRVAILGDSFVEAYQVESDRTFLAIAEKMLNADKDKQFELMNFGRSGTTQTEELLILKNDVLNFSPDVIVLFFCPGNDIADIDRATAGDVARPFFKIDNNDNLILDTDFNNSRGFKIKKSINWLKQHSALISLMTNRYNAYHQTNNLKARKQNLSEGSISGASTLCSSQPDERYKLNYLLNKRLIVEMARICQSKGIRFFLATVPTDWMYNPMENKTNLERDPGFKTGFFEEDMKDYAKSIGAEYIELQSEFQKFYEKNNIPLYWGKHGKWGHWNYYGHELVARRVAKELSKLNNQ
jgi:hypothetical protein